MRRRTALGLMLPLALALSLVSGVAFGAPAETATDAESGFGISALSDRYESLKDLSTSLTDEEGVVIATRIGVLASTNRALNNSDVSFSGEVVGDVMNAEPGFKWANLRGSSNSVISVFLTDEQTNVIQYVGDYHETGTTLTVSGIYHVACPEHQGELDVHALSVEVVDSGGPVTHLVSGGRFGLGIGLCALATMVLAAFIFVRWYYGKREDA